MAKNDVIEDTLIQISNLEESLNKNAQGILASTMKEEIANLVKESQKSIKEEDEEEIDFDDEVDTDVVDTDNVDDDMGDEVEDIEDVNFEEEPMAMGPMDSDEYDDDVVDMTDASDDELITVFKAMKSDDGIIVKKDDDMLKITDNEADTEYLVQLGESDMDFDKGETKEGRRSRRPKKMDDFDVEDFEFDLDYDPDLDDMPAFKTKWRAPKDEDDFEDFEFDLEEDYEVRDEVISTNENIYELELDEDNELALEFDPDDFELEEGDNFSEMELADSSVVSEAKKRAKAKMPKTGNASKFKYSKKPNREGGFKTVKKKPNKTMGTGKPKYEWNEEVNMEGFHMDPNKPARKKKGTTKKVETKEASRTLGNGKRWGRNGLDKPKAAPRHLRKESINKEVNLLREKNGEYKKALDLFRTKLNEVAIFNSNLAYATRLFTEHSTTKQEKINILRRFDNVDTLKESKNLYRSIKNELGSEKPMESTITESIQRNVERAPSTGSAANLIESKTYENPQFLRMKDLMGKIK